MSTLLVTGGCGYIGSHTVKKLLQEGHAVIVFDNLFRGYREVIEILSVYGKLIFIEGDLFDKDAIDKVFKKEKIDAVMHFAALCLPEESLRKPEVYFRNNVVGTLNLLEAMKNAEVKKLIFSSTCAVYGPAEQLPVKEDQTIAPVTPYGESKRIAEKMIEWFGKVYGMQYVIFRYFNVCGADSEGEIGDSKKPSELLVQNAVRGALGIEPFHLTCPTVDTPDETPIRDYVHVEDLADAHLKALTYFEEGKESVILNLGNGKGWSVKEIIDGVKKELGVDFKVEKSAERAGECKEVYADISRAKKCIGWEPKKTLQDSIVSLKKWYEKKPHGYKK